MKKVANIYGCNIFWTWMTEKNYASNGHFLYMNNDRRPDGYVVPAYKMLIGYLIEFFEEKAIAIPALADFNKAQVLYDECLERLIKYENDERARVKEHAIKIGKMNVVSQPRVSRGDKVIVKDLKWYKNGCQRRGSRYVDFEVNGVTFAHDMSEYCDQILTVNDTNGRGDVFNVEEDGGRFSWQIGMCLGVVI